MPKLFISDSHVPETCPPEMLLPNDPEYLGSSQPSHIGKVSPIEVSWILFSGEVNLGNGLHILRDTLLQFYEDGKITAIHDEIRDFDFMNHDKRVIGRIALDPRRHTRFSLFWTYKRDLGVRVPSINDEEFFKSFHDVYGVVER